MAKAVKEKADKAILSNYLSVDKSRVARSLFKKLTVANPKHAECVRLGYRPIVKRKVNGRTTIVPIPPKIKLYREDNNRILLPRGYYSIEELEKRGGFIDQRTTGRKIAITDSIKLRDYQKEPVELFAKNKVDMILAEPGSGKTVVGIKIICKLKRMTIVLVNTLVLAKQWKEALLKFTDLRASDIGIISAGQRIVGKVVIGTVQSILSLSRDSCDYPRWAKAFGLVILDEVHIHGALEFQKAGAMFPALRRLGITASSDRLDNINIQKFHVGKREVVMKQPGRYKPTMILIECLTRNPVRGVDLMPVYNKQGEVVNVKNYKMNSFNDFCHWITNDKRRNHAIKVVADRRLKAGRYVAILTHRVAHAEHLGELLKKHKPLIFHGKSLAQERGNLIIATYQKLKLGWDFDRLDTLFIATPIAKKTDVEQAVGRIERVMKNKPQPEVYYVFDKFIGLSQGLKRKAKIVMIKELRYHVEKKVISIKGGTDG